MASMAGKLKQLQPPLQVCYLVITPNMAGKLKQLQPPLQAR